MLSAVGQLTRFIPVIGDGLAFAASIPDILYDVEDAIKSPSTKSVGHVLLDGVNRITPLTETPVDDYVGGLGIIDDALQSIGLDIFDWVENSLKNVVLQKIKPIKLPNTLGRTIR